MSGSRRRYELKERARRQEETRRRIVDATVALHAEVGPARTTVAEIARRAGVSRLTVYAHFPDDRALFGACAAAFEAAHPMPDPAPWAEVADPDERLRRALGDLFVYYAANEAMLGHVMRDAATLPALAEVLADEEGERALRDLLLAGRRARGAARARLEAAVGLATAFETWQQLTCREGLADAAAIELLVRAVRAAA